MYRSCEVYKCFYNKGGCCLYDESPCQPPSIKACYDYDEEYLKTSKETKKAKDKKKSRTRISK